MFIKKQLNQENCIFLLEDSDLIAIYGGASLLATIDQKANLIITIGEDFPSPKK
jgi:hypothetical protein